MKYQHHEFLPAALEVQETPAPVLSHVIVWVIMLFFIIAVLWASISEIDMVGLAHGKIVPHGEVKTIQALQTARVKAIYVKEGQRVEQGQLLIELDATTEVAEVNQITEQLIALKLDKARLLYLIAGVDELNSNQDVFQGLAAAEKQIALYQQQARSEFNSYKANLQALHDEYQQRLADQSVIRHRIQQLNQTIPLITERVAAVERLLDQKLISRSEWLELEEQRIQQVKERDIQKQNTHSIAAAISNIQQRIDAMQSQFRSEQLAELGVIQTRIMNLEQEQDKAKQKMSTQTLTAPVSGKILQLNTHTIGGVVKPAEELMRIVPDDELIEIVAWLANKDIGFAYEGQPVEIKLETFPFTQYGTIAGHIKTLSTDAIIDENLGLVYAARVFMDKTTMTVNDKIVHFTPGMAATVELNMGKRKLIEYLLAPLLRYRDESVRER